MDPNNTSEGSVGDGNFLDKKDNKTVMGILAYLGTLVIVSYLVAKDDPFIKFHIKQGLVLVVIEVIVWVIASMMWPFFMFVNIINLAVLVLAIIGIVNVVERREKELPVVGQFSRHFSF